MSSYTDAIDDAVLATLAADSTLHSLMGSGASPEPPFVFFDFAPPNLTKFVMVQRVIAEDEYSMREHAYEKVLYTILAIEKSKNTTTTKAASKRIFDILQHATLTIEGYRNMLTQRRESLRQLEMDDDTGERWQRRGGRYEVWAAPNN